MFTLTLGLQVLLRSVKVRIGRPVDVLQLIDALILAMLAVDIYSVVTVSARSFYGGA